MKVCPYCHTPARFEAQKFCSACGKPFETTAPQPSAPAAPAKDAEPSPTSPAAVPEKPAPAFPEPKPQPEPARRVEETKKEQPAAAPEPAAAMPVRRRHKTEMPTDAALAVSEKKEEPPAPAPVVRRRRSSAESPAEPARPAPQPQPVPQSRNESVQTAPQRKTEPQTKPPETSPESAKTASPPAASDEPSHGSERAEAQSFEPPVARKTVQAAARPAASSDPEPEAPGQPAFERPSAQAVPNDSGAAPAPAQNKQSSPLKWIVIILAVVVVVLIGVLAFVLFGGGGKEDGSGSHEAVSSTAVPSASSATSASSAEAASEPSEAPGGAASSAAAMPQPTELPVAVPSESQVVIHNAIAEGATITVDGKAVQFSIVGTDAVIARDLLPDVCQVRIIAPSGDNSFQTAAVWFNKDYGNELSFNADYGGYVPCDATGRGKPGDKVVDVLTWAFYKSFLTSINNRDISNLRYSTAANTIRVGTEMSNYFDRQYELDDFSAVSTPSTILYSETDGTVIYDAMFRCIRTFDSGETDTSQNYRTIRLVWEDGMWKVDAFTLIDATTYSAGAYGQLP